MTDRIRIEGLSVLACVGVYPEEQQALRPLLIDLSCELDLSLPALTERLADTLDYDQLARCAQELSARRHYPLIETLAQHLAEQIVKDHAPRVLSVTVRIQKPAAIPNAQSVSVELTRRPLEFADGN
jgi:dihydroneopterin aldolase